MGGYFQKIKKAQTKKAVINYCNITPVVREQGQ